MVTHTAEELEFEKHTRIQNKESGDVWMIFTEEDSWVRVKKDEKQHYIPLSVLIEKIQGLEDLELRIMDDMKDLEQRIDALEQPSA